MKLKKLHRKQNNNINQMENRRENIKKLQDLPRQSNTQTIGVPQRIWRGEKYQTHNSGNFLTYEGKEMYRWKKSTKCQVCYMTIDPQQGMQL